MRPLLSGPGEGLHQQKSHARQMLAPKPCREVMGIETCFECKLPDCDEERGRHWLRDESKREGALEIS